MVPSIQIDPVFPYYAKRSPESVAEELALAGYRIVHIFVTNEFEVDEALVEALRQKGLEVWALTLGNGSFTTAHLPTGWQGWQMGLLKPVNDGYTRLSPFCSEYVAWKKQALAQLVKKIRFDGLEIAEPYLPEWNGLESGTYGDVGAYAERAFRRRCGLPIPEFRDRDSLLYYKKQPQLYNEWVKFRVDGVNSYVDEIINGSGGVRDAKSGIRIATWTLAVDAGKDSVAKLREVQGNDAAAMITKVRPDLHYLQTHWPEWSRADLPAHYVRGYSPFIREIQKAHPTLPIGLQTDIGSAKRMIRSRRWLEQNMKETSALGCATWTAYEYHLGGPLYEEAPRLLMARRSVEAGLELVFHKRIAALHHNEAVQAAVRSHGSITMLQPQRTETDGHILRLYGVIIPEGSFELGVKGIADTPELLLYPPQQANRSLDYQWVRLDEDSPIRYTSWK